MTIRILKKKTLRKGKEFVDYAEKKGATVRQGKGLRSKIIKWFIGIGLGLLAIFFIMQNLF
jgi:hypothetical protein